MTYSAVIMCTRSRIVITDVTYDGPHLPLKSYATLHWLGDGSSSVISMAGKPDPDNPEWAALGGRFERVSPNGTTVVPTCSNGPDVELLTTVRSGAGGAELDDIVIEYTQGGSDYQLSVPYRYISCGASTQSKRFCN